MWRFLRRILCRYPIWAYGLECGICKMTFISERSHYQEVIERGTLHNHEGKIPILR